MLRSLSRSALALGLALLPACSAELASEDELASVAEEELVVSSSYAAVGRNSAGTTQLFGPGRHYAYAGDLGTVGNDAIRSFRLPPASRVRYCNHEGGTGGSGLECATIYNYATSTGGWINVLSGYHVSFIEVTPVALMFRNTSYGGTMEAFNYGEHRAASGSFMTVGNDAASSLYVPPGARVRVCSDEGGATGHGFGTCATYDAPVTDIDFIGGVSYAEVDRVATVFRDASLTGTGMSHGPGVWTASGGGLAAIGNDTIESIVVPFGLSARLCSDDTASGTGFGDCVTYTRSQVSLGVLANRGSFLSVTPFDNGTASLSVTVSPTSDGTGSVRSVPFGLSCSTATCSASFHDRSLVALEADAASDVDVRWSGCTSTSFDTCYVQMSGARSVTVTFDRQVLDEACHDDCVLRCDFLSGPERAACLHSCTDRCTS